MPPSKATSTPDRSGNPRYRFVGGKGGVGKTTCAAALAVVSARSGRSTLVISTDPAPSLGDALGQRLGPAPRPVRGVRGLHAVEVDAAATFGRWLEPRRDVLEDIALRGTWLDRDDVTKLLRLSLPGIDEITGLLEIAELGKSGRYDQIVVDTAPTGHLLRMLGTPAVFEGLAEVFDHMQAKHRVLVAALRGTWTEDAADALITEIDDRARAMRELLRDPDRAAMYWVTLPEHMAVEETLDAIGWLRAEGIVVDGTIVNRVTPPPPGPCRWCSAVRRTEGQAVRALAAAPLARDLPVIPIAALDREPRGIPSLARIGRILQRPPRVSDVPKASTGSRVVAKPLAAGLRPVNGLLADPHLRLVMFGGKGGVGKTTCAAAAALEAAKAAPRRRILLLSTDPAHSLGDVLGQKFSDVARGVRGGPRNLMVRELDAGRALREVRDRVADGIEQLFRRVAAQGAIGGTAAEHDHRVMRDLTELAPPGIDEVVAVVEIVESLEAADSSRFDLIVMDTAPTGHALRLIETPALVHDWVKVLMAILLKYQPLVGVGELGSVLLRLSQGLGRLRAVMGDPGRTRLLAVTRPAALPRAETGRLLRRLAAADVSAPVVIVNATGAGTCRRCGLQRAAQLKEIALLRKDLEPVRAHAVVVAPAEVPPPHGATGLERWRKAWREASTPKARG
jgi:arsenite/tail-anchored protein-transporting ATPase